MEKWFRDLEASEDKTVQKSEVVAMVKIGPSFCYLLNNDYRRTSKIVITQRWLENESPIWINIPKTGTNSIEIQLNHALPAVGLGHVYSQFYPRSMWSRLRTIVRNPYDRAVSAYFFMKSGGFNDNKQYRELVRPHTTFEAWVLEGLKKEFLYDFRTYYAMEPTIPQYMWLFDSNEERVIPDEHIGRFENLVPEVKRLTDVDLVMHTNKTDHAVWPTYYRNPEVKERIYSLYRRDFEVLGYSSDIPEV